MSHFIDVSPVVFTAIANGNKPFETKSNALGFQKGDLVTINESIRYENNEYKRTGRKLQAAIGYVTSVNQKSNYVAFSLLEIQEVK